MPHKKTLIEVNTMSLDNLTRIIKEVWEERYFAYREKLDAQRAAFYNLPSADPPALDDDKNSVDTGERYQSDTPRQVTDKLVSRIAENHYEIVVRPASNSAKDKESADYQEKVVNPAFRQLERRSAVGTTWQALAADAQVRMKGGYIHWRPDYKRWPTLAHEYVDTLPDDDKERERYRDQADEDGDNAGRYRETDEAATERQNRNKALAGLPWLVEVLHPSEPALLPSSRTENGIGLFVRVRDVSFIDYADELAELGHYARLDADAKFGIDGPLAEPPLGWDTSRVQSYGKQVRLASVWTDKECYELVAAGNTASSRWELIRSFSHPMQMPPIVHIPARVRNEPEPDLRYEGELTGVLRTKAQYDRARSYADMLLESTANPEVWFETADGALWVADGMPPTLDLQSSMKVQLPTGVVRKVRQPDVSQGLIKVVEWHKEDMESSLPQMGTIEAITGTTQPWTAFAQQSEANRGPKLLIQAQAEMLAIMFRNILYVHTLPAEAGGFGEEIAVYAFDGTNQHLMTLAPKDIVSDAIEVRINEMTEANGVTRQQTDTMLFDKGFLTRTNFVEESMHRANASEHLQAVDVDLIWRTHVLPSIGELTKARLGLQWAFGADGQQYDLNGQRVQPGQVTQRNNGDGGGAGMVQGARPPGLPDLQPPMGPGGEPLAPRQPGIRTQ